MERPTIGNTEAVFQAGSTVKMYLTQATTFIDELFCPGYAEAHPELLAECIRSQTLDFNSTALCAALFEIKDSLEERAE